MCTGSHQVHTCMKYHVSLAVLRISLIYSVSVAVRCVNKIIFFYFYIYFFLFLFFVYLHWECTVVRRTSLICLIAVSNLPYCRQAR